MTTPEMEQALLEKWRALSPEQQQATLEFANSLPPLPTPGAHPRRNLLGLCSDLQVRISTEDVAQARREIWGSLTQKAHG